LSSVSTAANLLYCSATDASPHQYDIGVSGGRAVPIETRRQRVDAEAARLAGLGAMIVGVLSTEGLDHYGVAMTDPEGNEFDIN
jgi:hypothetical protein